MLGLVNPIENASLDAENENRGVGNLTVIVVSMYLSVSIDGRSLYIVMNRYESYLFIVNHGIRV